MHGRSWQVIQSNQTVCNLFTRTASELIHVYTLKEQSLSFLYPFGKLQEGFSSQG